MNITQLYAISVGGSSLIILLLHSPRAIALMRWMAFLWSRHLTYRYLLYRYRYIGPWSRAGVLLQAIYIAVNIICMLYRFSNAGFRGSTVSEVGSAAGTLSIINAVPLFAGPVADFLGLPIGQYKKIHRSAGLICFALVLIHILIAVSTKASFSFVLSADIFAFIGVSALSLISLLCIPIFRSLSYELFLRVHQALAVLFVYSTWRHLPSDNLFPRFYIYLATALYGIASISQGGLLVYRILRRGRSGARITQAGKAVHIRIMLQQPLKIKAGQYINLWIPSVSFWSFAQCHPFVVISWAKGPQEVLELFIEPRKGLTREIMEHVNKDGLTTSHHVLFTGPHGSSLSITEYGEVILIASGFGIAAQLPYLKQLVLGYNPRIVCTRRIHLIWQVNNIVDTISAQPLLNEILHWDNKDDDCQLSISIYIETGDVPKYSFGERAKLYPGKAPLHDIFEIEFYECVQVKQVNSGGNEAGVELSSIKRTRLQKFRSMQISSEDELPLHLPERQHDLGISRPGMAPVGATLRKREQNMLITVSASGEVRDELRSIVRNYLDKHVDLKELDYQPSS